MSQKTPTPTNKPAQLKGLSAKQIKRIWSELKPQPLLEKLRGLQPTARWSASGSRLSGCCPFHDERTPSFHVYLDRGYAKCFGCEKYLSNPIELWAALRQTSRADALTDLRQQFGLKFVGGVASAVLDAWETHQQLKKRLMSICHDALLNAVAAPNSSVYAWAQPAITYLLNVRRIPADALPSLPIIGIMPPMAMIYEQLDKDAALENERRAEHARQHVTRPTKVSSLAPAAQAYLYALTRQNWIGALVFRLDATPDTISRLKLRRPDTRDFMLIEDDYEEETGFFGLSWPLYRSLLGAQQRFVPGAYVVEGEFDALTTMAQQVLAGGPTFMTVAGGGSATGAGIDTLRECGFEEAYLVGDAPTKKGDELIKQWLPQVSQLRSRVFVGYHHFPGASDPDEAVLQHGLAQYQQVMLQVNNRDMFAMPQDWCFQQAQPELDQLSPSDMRQLIETAGSWGRLLRNAYECDAYINTCATTYGLPAHLVKREIVSREEDEPAFILRIVDTLATMFTVIGQRVLDADRRLFLWHRETRRIIQVSLADDSSVERELGATLGPAYQLFRDKIGIPAFLEVRESERAVAHLQKQDAQFRWYLRQALTHMATSAPDYDTAPHKGQGIHVVRDPLGGPPTIYLVNGRDVFIGTFDEHGALSWVLGAGPVHNGIIFDVGLRAPAPAMFDFVAKPADLARATTLDPLHLYKQLHRALDIGWVFKDQALTVDFLAAHLLSVTVSDAFRRKVLMGIHADTSAGKSRLLMGLIGGSDFPRIHLIAAARSMANFTAAGIRQTTNNSSRPLCLDEFEDEGLGDKKGRTITEVFEMYRNLTGEANRYTMGQRGGDPVTYTLEYPVFIAAINKAKKVQDANRTVTVQLKKVANRLDPQHVLLMAFGIDGLRQLKEDLAVCLLPHVHKLQQAYAEIETEYGRGAGQRFQLDQRYFEGLYPALTIMKFLGLNYNQFLMDFCALNQESFQFGATHTDSMELFHYVCTSPKLLVRGLDGGVQQTGMSVMQLLASPEDRARINSTNSGVYYDEVSATLIVNWTAAQQIVLNQHPKYSRETNLYNLRELANRAPHAIPTDELLRSGILSRLRASGLGAVPTSYLTAYRMRSTLDALNTPGGPSELPVAAPQSPRAPDVLKRAQHDNDSFDT